ncbi:hypothetical protein BGP75_02000 [Motiliproteus sp. MSK22-1]|nr:hypothetical protein BGP75_02000 [Motiliproteus sp. MSK22-1]
MKGGDYSFLNRSLESCLWKSDIFCLLINIKIKYMYKECLLLLLLLERYQPVCNLLFIIKNNGLLVLKVVIQGVGSGAWLLRISLG